MKRSIKTLLIGISILIGGMGFAQNRNQKKVLFVVTSHDKLGDTGEKTGLWIEEFATPYYALIDQGIQVVIASPKGGQPPVDPKSTLADYQTESTKRFYSDQNTQEAFSNTVKLSEVNSKDFHAIFYPGGHGPLWDLTVNKTSIQLIEDFYKANKPIAFVCHAPAVLKHVKNSKGDPLVKGKEVTGFTNGEEKAVGLTNVVPFLVEDMLIERGGIYKKGKDWSPFAVQDGMLITGQNPQSAELVAGYLIETLVKK